jgi:hypothetical protein
MQYSLMGEMRLPFIDSDLLFRGALIKTDLTVQPCYYNNIIEVLIVCSLCETLK